MNPYAVLGLSKSATKEEVKAAWRKLVKEHHPDRGGSRERFQEIQAAYEMLSDDAKRREYDTFKPGPFSTGRTMDDMFESLFRSAWKPYTRYEDRYQEWSPPTVGEPIHFDLTLTFEEMALGCTRTFTITRRVKCTECKGVGGEDIHPCKYCEGRGKIRSMRGYVSVESGCTVCKGRGKVPNKSCLRCAGAGLMLTEQKINLKLSPGIETESTATVTAFGHEVLQGTTGDLLVRIKVRRHEYFTRDHLDVHCTLRINAIRAMLGCEVTIKTIHGEAKLSIPPGAQNKQTAVIHGEGIWSDKGTKGNQHVHLKIVVPTLTEKQKELLTEILIAEIEEGTKTATQLDPLQEVLRR